ncbi:MAG TPA: serine hydrolase domain-containing protein [Caulobacteraceae bacterium]|nr:serine hydrolase domain-containing protein [Caulobacteraceae bacterium]
MSDGPMGKALDAVLAEALAAKKIVGGVVMVAKDGATAYAQPFGMADREAGKPCARDTIFRFASLTKPLMAVLTLALIERGTLALTDPVTKFLPGFRPKLADGSEPVITVRHLLTHTSGLRYRFFEPAGGAYERADISDGMDIPGRTFEDNLARIASVPLAFPPGAAWAYSVAYDVLGAAIEKATGKPLPEVMREVVTGPLGMSDTAFVVEARDRLATAYGDGSPEPVRMGAHHLVPFGPGALSYAPDRMFDPASFPSGGGGMSGTAPDFLAFLEAMRNGGAPVISQASVEALSKDAIGNMMVLGPGATFSLGWSIVTDAALGAPQSVGTWRWGGVYGNSWFVDPAKALSVVIVTNTAIAGMTGPFPDAVRDAIYLAL